MNRATGRLNAIDRREALRYLGYTLPAADISGAEGLLDECEGKILAAQDLKAVYEFYDISFGEELDLGFTKTNSRDLTKYLRGCRRIILFAATAGVGVDRVIARYSAVSPARAAVSQALGAALAEGWCNELQASFVRQYGALKSRFSCGFGDLPLAMQRDIFAALSVTKNIGVTLSEDCFMTPSKSVTAIVGIR